MSLSDEDAEEDTATDDTFDARKEEKRMMTTLSAWLAVKDKCISLLDYSNLVSE